MAFEALDMPCYTCHMLGRWECLMFRAAFTAEGTKHNPRARKPQVHICCMQHLHLCNSHSVTFSPLWCLCFSVEISSKQSLRVLVQPVEMWLQQHRAHCRCGVCFRSWAGWSGGDQEASFLQHHRLECQFLLYWKICFNDDRVVFGYDSVFQCVSLSLIFPLAAEAVPQRNPPSFQASSGATWRHFLFWSRVHS